MRGVRSGTLLVELDAPKIMNSVFDSFRQRKLCDSHCLMSAKHLWMDCVSGEFRETGR